MTPLFYTDLTTKPKADGPHGTVGLVARLLFVLHGAFRNLGKPYAVAFPEMRTGEFRHPGKIIRVFAETRDMLDELLDNVEQHAALKSFTVGRVRAVPEGFDGKWVEYRRFNIPGRSSYLTECRARRLQEGDSLPYLRMTSRSNQQSFSVYFQALNAIKPDGSATAMPDSYGLASTTRSFAVPDMPV